MKEFAIICIGYNRVYSLKRLFDSLNQVVFRKEEKVDLIISLDHCDNLDCKNLSEALEWTHGNKIVNYQAKPLGLKKHILSLGKYFDEYENLIVLEDDLVVSDCLMNYARAAVQFYKAEDSVAGISLYSINWNQTAQFPFTPALSKFDTYFIQYAQSWGQIWMKNQWLNFKKWLNDLDEECLNNTKIPVNVRNWSKKSWLKYHIIYCILNGKYFIYPYHSISTCFSDAGEHTIIQENSMQTVLETDFEKKYRFPKFGNSSAVYYDSFFEREKIIDKEIFLANVDLTRNSNISAEKIEFDLYGQKDLLNLSNQPYLVTSQKQNISHICSFGLNLKPHEENILKGVPGEFFYLYKKDNLDKYNMDLNKIKKNQIYLFSYYHQILGHTNLIFKYLKSKSVQEVMLRIKKGK